MSKPRYSSELKIRVAKAYLNGEGSYKSLANAYGVGHKLPQKTYTSHEEI